MVNPDRNLYEPPYDDALLYDGDLEPERPRSRPLVVLLGVVVLAAFAGVVWVAYNQGVKQGQRGNPPILSADSGPTRIMPDQLAADPQSVNPAPDKSYERLWGETRDKEGQENVLPRAEQPRTVPAPQDVASNDATAKAEGSMGGPLESKASDVPPPSDDPRLDSTVGSVNPSTATADSTASTAPRTIMSAPPAIFGPRPQAEDITSALSPVESVTSPVSAPRSLAPTTTPATTAKPAAAKVVTVTQTPPATPAATKPTTMPAATAASVADAAPPTEKKVAALAPSTKPAAISEPPAEKKVAAIAPAAEPAPESAPPAASGGKVMIQLGSFPNDALAASAWSRIKSAKPDLLGSYSPSIKPAEIAGKGTWYRLRVGGFADKAAAAEVCNQLKADGQACIIAAK